MDRPVGARPGSDNLAGVCLFEGMTYGESRQRCGDDGLTTSRYLRIAEG